MRIAYVTARYPYGAGEAFFEPEIARLAQLAGSVILVPTRPGRGAPARAARADRLDVPLWSVRTLYAALLVAVRHPAQVARVTATICGERYPLAAKLKNLAVLPKALATAAALRRERIDHIHAQWLSTPSTVAYVVHRLTGIPWSCTAHRFDIFERNLLAVKAGSARFVRTISARNAALIAERGAPPGTIRLLHLGVDIPAAQCTHVRTHALRLISPAALVPVKGHDVLIAALALLRDRGVAFTCDFAGDGPQRERIAASIRNKGLETRIALRGHVDHDRLCRELRAGQYDLAVLASTESGTLFEGIPVALMEAMAAGVPCVATSTGSITELCADGSGCTLVPQRDPHALAGAIERYAKSRAARSAAGQRARASIARRFDADKTVPQLYALMADAP